MGLQPKTARVLRDGQEYDISTEEVLIGDVVLVRPGEKSLLMARRSQVTRP